MKAVAEIPKTASKDSSNVLGNKRTESNESKELREQKYSNSLSKFKLDKISILPSINNGVQTKLKIGAPNDKYEKEADRIADKIVGISDSSIQIKSTSQKRGTSFPNIQRKCLKCEEESIQTKTSGSSSGDVSVSVMNQIQKTRGGGRVMDNTTQSYMSSRFGTDLSGVRIHNDASSVMLNKKINSRAFTIGQDVYFNQGEYSPNSIDGKRLLAHELTHVIQQKGNGPLGKNSRPNFLQRKKSTISKRIENLLSYGFFDWVITDAEALEALNLLKTLSNHQQAVFISNKKYYDRLHSNLDKSKQKELQAIRKKVSALLPPSKELEKVRSNLSYGVFDWAITDAEAVESLEMLKKLPSKELPTALDSIDYERLLDNLPKNRKQELIKLKAKATKISGTYSDLHNLTSPRFKNFDKLQRVYDGKEIIAQGEKGVHVGKIQHAIHDAGFRFGGKGIDEDFGGETKRKVKDFQKANSIKSDPSGKVGAETIGKLDKIFPVIKPPSGASKAYNFSCMLEILCGWNKAMIKDLKNATVIMVEELYWADEKFNGSSWDPDKTNGAGETDGSTLRIATNDTCETVAMTLYHEYQHFRSPGGMGWAKEEQYAFRLETNWAIDRGLKVDPSLVKKNSSGQTVVNNSGVNKTVNSYPGISTSSTEEIQGKVGRNRVRVKDTSTGRSFTRAAKKGDTVEGPRRVKNPKTVPTADWKC